MCIRDSSHIRNLNIIGDIGCYTLGAGHPWNALDTCISMGASLSMAHGMDKGRGESDDKKSIVAVIGDSTFLHMGMQGLLNMIYNRGNVTVSVSYTHLYVIIYYYRIDSTLNNQGYPQNHGPHWNYV